MSRRIIEPVELTEDEKVEYIAGMSIGDIYPTAFREDVPLTLISMLARRILKLERELAEHRDHGYHGYHPPEISHYDSDLVEALKRGVEAYLREQEQVCTCGHKRKDHFAATGALGSFGGSACNLCWDCAMFIKTSKSSH